MHGVKFKRKKDIEKAKGGRTSSVLHSAAPVIGKQKAIAEVAPRSNGPPEKVEDRATLHGEGLGAKVPADNPKKKQKVEGPALNVAAVPTDVREQAGDAAAPLPPPAAGKRKSRASLGAAVAQAAGAVAAKEIPQYEGATEPEVPLHEGLTQVLEDKRLVQLLRHVCRHEQETIDATFTEHPYLARGAEVVLRGWVRSVQELLKQDPTIVDTTQSIVAGGSSPAAGRAEEEDEEEERREALLTLRSSFLSEEQAWQRLVEAQKGVLQRDADARKEAPPPHPQAVESAGVDEALEETRRKLAFQAEALCQLVSGVSDVCRRAEQASKDLAQDFNAKFTSILPQGSPRTLISRFMSYHPAAGPS